MLSLKMPYFNSVFFCLAAGCCFGVEAEREAILERMARVHIEHNMRFNAEYYKLRETSRDKAKQKKSQKGDGK